MWDICKICEKKMANSSKLILSLILFDIKDGNLDTTTALVYDAVHIFALALHELNLIQNINIGPIDCSGVIFCSPDPTTDFYDSFFYQLEAT